MRQEDFESLNWLVVLSKGLISLKQLFWILFHFNVKKFVFSITSNTLVWQARAIENIGKHWSMPAGRQMLTWSNQFIEVKVGTASSTTLYNYYNQSTYNENRVELRQLPWSLWELLQWKQGCAMYIIKIPASQKNFIYITSSLSWML